MNDDFFITGGTLPPDADSYITRQADEELLDGLKRGEFCYVLNTRQMGKSSLMARAAQRLKADGWRVVVLDLTSVGQNLTVEQWYAGLLARVSRQTEQQGELLDYWRAHRDLGPMQRFLEALRLMLLAPASAPEETPRRFVIFVDEIDAVRSLPFSADEFFAGIRECYNRRAHDPVFNRLTFCLLGVATPSDLIQDTRISPFNIGRRIELRDFTHDEAAPLARGLKHPYALRLLQRVLHWTGGHPYLTQRLCRAVVEVLARRAEEQPLEKTDEFEGMALVDRECERLFLSKAAQETDDNLTFVRSRLLRGETDVAALLDVYLQILKGRRIRDDETNPLCGVLRLSGITTTQRGLLRPRNRIYDRVFNREWVLANLPDAEIRRQKQAYRRGVLRAASVFGSVAFVGMLLLGVAVVNAARARDSAGRARVAEKRAEMQGRRADTQAEEARRLLYFSDLRLIQSEWENSNLGHVQNLLDETRLSPQRGWEWDYWNRLAHHPAQAIALGGTAVIVRFSPSDHLAIEDGFLPLTDYDLRTGARKSYSGGGWTGGQSVDYAPDGSRLWRCADAGIQDAFTGQIVLRAQRLATVCALRDGTGLLTTTLDGTLCLWSLPALKRVWQPPQTRIDIKPLIVGSGHALARDTQGKWHLYRLRDGLENHAFDAELELFRPSALAFSRDDALLAGEARSGGILLLDLHTGKISLPLGAEQTLKAIRFGPNDTTIIAAFWGSVQVWDRRARQERNVFRERVDFKVNWGRMDSSAISPDGRYVATGDGHTEKIWDMNAPGEVGLLETSSHGLWHTSYSPDGSIVTVAGNDGDVYRYEARTGVGLPVLKGDGVRVNMAAYSHNGRWIAAGRDDGGVWVWDARTGRRLAAFRAHAKLVETVCFSRDDRTLLTASDDCLGKLWDVGAEETIEAKTPSGANTWHCALRQTLSGHGLGPKYRGMGLEAAVFSPDETRILTGSDDHTAKLWDAHTGVVMDTYPMPCEVWGAAFAPDGRRVVFSLLNNTAEIWDTDTHHRDLVLQGHTNWVTDVAFSPDGRRIVTGSRDATARVWDAQSGRELLALKGHQGQVSGVAFSPDGNQIATSGRDGTLRLWNAAPLPDMPAPDMARR